MMLCAASWIRLYQSMRIAPHLKDNILDDERFLPVINQVAKVIFNKFWR